MAEDDDPYAHIGVGESGRPRITVQARQQQDDDPYAHIQPPATIGATIKDVAKQAGAGILSGIEAGATFVPSMVGAVAGYLNPEFDAERKALREKYGEPGISGWLPKAETPAGTYTRTAAEFVPAAIQGGIRRGLGETWRQFFQREAPGMATRGVGGALTGAASEAAGQALEGSPLEPIARIGVALAGGRATQAAERSAANRAIDARMREMEAATN